MLCSNSTQPEVVTNSGRGHGNALGAALKEPGDLAVRSRVVAGKREDELPRRIAVVRGRHQVGVRFSPHEQAAGLRQQGHELAGHRRRDARLGREPTLVPVTGCVGVGVRLVAGSGAPRQRRRRLKKGQRPTVARIRQQLQRLHGHRRRLVLCEAALLPWRSASAARSSAHRAGGSCPPRRRRESPPAGPTRVAAGAPMAAAAGEEQALPLGGHGTLGCGGGCLSPRERKASGDPGGWRRATCDGVGEVTSLSLVFVVIEDDLIVDRRVVLEWRVELDLGPRRDRRQAFVAHPPPAPSPTGACTARQSRTRGRSKRARGCGHRPRCERHSARSLARPPGSPSGRPARSSPRRRAGTPPPADEPVPRTAWRGRRSACGQCC